MIPDARRWRRALVGLVAVYGFLLQALLTAAVPVDRPDGLGVLCSASDDGGTTHDKPVRRAHPCCTPGHLGGVTPPSPPEVFAISARRDWVAIAWGLRIDAAPRRLPTYARSARGPPQT